MTREVRTRRTVRRYDIVGQRIMRERKSKLVLMGEGPYYHPTASLGSLKHNYRYLFLSAIEKRTPEVLTRLRYRVWPAYDSMHWRIDPLVTQEEWLYKIHPNLAWSWMQNIHPRDWTRRAKRVLTPIKKQLFVWSKQHQLHYDWMLMQALDTMYFWSLSESEAGRLRREANWARLLARVMKTKPLDIQTCEELDHRQYSWATGFRWFFPKDPGQQFSYAGWQGENEDDYKRSVRAEFDRHLADYLSKVRARAAELPKTPRLSKPERFEMLALYLCCNMNREKIAAAGFNKDPTVIYRDIQKAAELIDLRLRKPGRRR